MAKVHLIFCLRYVVWNDATCEKSGRRFFCKFSDVPVFHLRGLSDCQVQQSTFNSRPSYFHFFLPQLEAFDYKFKWTKTLEKVLQRMCSWKGSFCSKAFNIETHNNRIDIPWLGTKVQGSSGKAPMTLGWADYMLTWRCNSKQGGLWSFWENRPETDFEESKNNLPIWSLSMEDGPGELWCIKGSRWVKPPRLRFFWTLFILIYFTTLLGRVH